METIGLTGKPLHQAPADLTADVTDCHVDLTSPTTEHANLATIGTSGTPRVIRHQRTVKINGNEYAHIWESPLTGGDVTGGGAACNCSLAAGTSMTPAHMDCSHYRTVVRGDPSALTTKNTTYLFRPPHGDCYHLYGSTTARAPIPPTTPTNAQHLRSCAAQNLVNCEAVTMPRYSSLESKENAINNSNSPNL